MAGCDKMSVGLLSDRMRKKVVQQNSKENVSLEKAIFDIDSSRKQGVKILERTRSDLGRRFQEYRRGSVLLGAEGGVSLGEGAAGIDTDGSDEDSDDEDVFQDAHSRTVSYHSPSASLSSSPKYPLPPILDRYRRQRILSDSSTEGNPRHPVPGTSPPAGGFSHSWDKAYMLKSLRGMKSHMCLPTQALPPSSVRRGSVDSVTIGPEQLLPDHDMKLSPQEYLAMRRGSLRRSAAMTLRPISISDSDSTSGSSYRILPGGASNSVRERLGSRSSNESGGPLSPIRSTPESPPPWKVELERRRNSRVSEDDVMMLAALASGCTVKVPKDVSPERKTKTKPAYMKATDSSKRKTSRLVHAVDNR